MMRLSDILHHKDEKIVYFLRHHWIVYAYPVGMALVLSVAPLLAGSMMSSVFTRISPSLQGMLTIFLSVYYLGIWLFLFTAFLTLYLDVWIVTTRRIVYIEQHSLFSRTIAEQSLLRVQDVTSEVKGVLSTFLGYGNIHVQTAGESKRFGFKAITNPLEVSRTIFKLVDDVHAKPASS